MKKRIKRLDCVVIIIVTFLLHLPMRFISCDDPVYISQSRAAGFNLVKILIETYYCWSSRVLMQFSMYAFSYLPHIIWKIVDSVIVLILYVLLVKIAEIIIGRTTEDALLRLCVLLFFSWPFSIMGSTGWITTTTNVLWVGACFEYTVYLTLKRIRKKIISNGELGCGILAALYAANHESCLPMMVFYLLLVAIITNMECFKDLYYKLLIVISLCMFILMAFCPGLRLRMEMNRGTEIPYSAYTIWSKLRMGIATTFYHLWSVPNALFFILLFCLGYYMSIKYRSSWKRYLFFIPVVLDMSMTAYVFVKYSLLNRMLQYVYPDIECKKVPMIEQIIVISIGIAIYTSILFFVYVLMEKDASIILIAFCIMFLIPVAELCFTPDISLSLQKSI